VTEQNTGRMTPVLDRENPSAPPTRCGPGTPPPVRPADQVAHQPTGGRFCLARPRGQRLRKAR
jgi:hypothetical protein